MNEQLINQLFGGENLYVDRMQRGRGIVDSMPSHRAQNADGIARMQSQQTADARQLAQELRPLQESLIGARGEGTPFPMNENERAATIQAMLEIIQRPAWSAEERMAEMDWMREFGALPPQDTRSMEDQIFMPPGR